MAHVTVPSGQPQFLPVEDLQTWDHLGRIVRQLRSNPSLSDDLLQEGLIHLWQVQQQNPGQTLSWYLQSCRFHLLLHFVCGRIVDSLKRRNHQVQFAADEGQESFWENLEGPECVMAEVSVRDILVALAERLSELEQRVLYWLAAGLGMREIARQLDISHPTVIKSRRKIAGLARDLSIAPGRSGNGCLTTMEVATTA